MDSESYSINYTGVGTPASRLLLNSSVTYMFDFNNGNRFSEGTVFIRQNLTSIDVRF